MLLRRTALATSLAALALAGCGGEEAPSTPVDCLDDAAAYREALSAAPGEVALAGVPLPACLPDEQPAGDLAEVGDAMIRAGGELAREAADGDRESAIGFGYLLGVVEVRSERSSVHYDLGLRIGSEQAPLADASNAVRGAVAEGLEAGRSAAASG